MVTLIRKLLSPLLIFDVISRYQRGAALMKIQAAQTYVAGVKKARILSLGVFLVFFSFLLLGNGFFLIHLALFSYSPWSVQVKFILAWLLGAMEFFGAVIILIYLFREETWIRFCGIQTVINSVVEGKSENK